MKKIFIIIFGIVLTSGCNREKVQPKKEIVVKKSVITEVKEYYVGKVTYINHDDYFEYENNDVSMVQVSNNYEAVEKVTNNEVELTSKETEIVNDDVEVINEENNIIEEIVDSIVFDEEDVEVNKNYDKNEEIISSSIVPNPDLKLEEENLVTENISDEKLSSNIELKDNDKIQEETSDIESSNEVMNEKLEVPNETIVGYYAPNGMYLGETKVKVIDVSYYQGDINWDVFARESDCYGVILRLGYYDSLDKKFERNINELKRLNIPYGIYLFSYATTINGSNKEAIFTNKMIDKYELDPVLGIYYDIESWNASNGASSNDITKEEYDIIISNYINKVSSYIDNKYKVKVYSGRWYAMNRLGATSKSYVDWVAEYNSTLKYDSSYSMWQYTSKGSVPGIIGNVDISYLY